MNEEIYYTIKSGDTLSKIAKDLLGNSSKYLEIAKQNNISDPNKINVGQTIKVVRRRTTPPPTKSYRPGITDDFNNRPKDFLTYINLNNNSNNSNNSSVSTNIPKTNKIITKFTNSNNIYDTDQIKEFENSINSKSNLDIINYYRSKNDLDEYYIIDDKPNNRLGIFKNGKLVGNWMSASHGKIALDENNNPLPESDSLTVTKINSDGSIKDGQGNMRTGAGYFRIQGIGDYHGAPSFTRTHPEDYVEGAIVDTTNPSSIHARINNYGRVTNGCTGMCQNDLKRIAKYIKQGSDVYVLPDSDQSKFYIRNGNLAFSSFNNQALRSYQTINTDPIVDISINTDSKFTNNQRQVIDQYLQSLITNKEYIQNIFNINNDTYNQLAKYAYGILGNESTFGNKNTLVGNLIRGVRKLLNPNNSNIDIYMENELAKKYPDIFPATSLGLTQINPKYLGEKTKQIMKDKGIDIYDLTDPNNAALVTIAKLAESYLGQGLNYDKALREFNKSEVYRQRVKNYAEQVSIKQAYNM